MLLSGFLTLTFPVTFLIQPWTTCLGVALISNKSLFVIYENILQTWCTPIWWGNFFQVCQVETLIIYHTVWCMYPYTCANVHMHIEKYKFTNFLKNKGIQNQFQLTGGVSNPMAFLQKPSFIVYTLYITHTTHSIWKLMQIWHKMLGCYLPHVCLALEKKIHPYLWKIKGAPSLKPICIEKEMNCIWEMGLGGMWFSPRERSTGWFLAVHKPHGIQIPFQIK